MSSDGIHSGHRSRMRAKILDGKVSGFTDHELLEFLLFYTIPRVNTNELAHELLRRFGSLARIADASFEDLCSVKGISKKSAALIKTLPQLSDHFSMCDRRPSFASPAEVCAYVRNDPELSKEGTVKLYCLTSSLRLISSALISNDGLMSLSGRTMAITSEIIKSHGRGCILAVKSGDRILPNVEERTFLSEAKNLLQTLEISLNDCIIISPEGVAISMVEAQMFQ